MQPLGDLKRVFDIGYRFFRAGWKMGTGRDPVDEYGDDYTKKVFIDMLISAGI